MTRQEKSKREALALSTADELPMKVWESLWKIARERQIPLVTTPELPLEHIRVPDRWLESRKRMYEEIWLVHFEQDPEEIQDPVLVQKREAIKKLLLEKARELDIPVLNHWL